MATVRVSLHALGFPRVSSNCLLVLQKLNAEGFNIIIKDVYYKDRDAIISYFDRLNIPFTFSKMNEPEIDILNRRFRILRNYYYWKNQDSWEEIDRALQEREIYARSDVEYIPNYSPDSFFVVYNYGDRDQKVDSKPGTLGVIKQKASRSVNEGKVRTATVVDSNSLRIAGVSDSDGYEEFTELLYFNTAI